MFIVYVIKSGTTGKFYIRQSVDYKRRIKQHNDPNCKLGRYTKLNKGPWVLIYKEKFNNRAEAIKREKQLKSSRGRDFIRTHVLGR